MTYIDFDHWLVLKAEQLPQLRGDRSLNNMAKQAETSAQGAAGSLGSTASGIGAQLIPGLERQANAPPGMAPADLANEQAQSQEAAGGTAGALKGALATRAMRMGNPANLNSTAAAVGEGASRAQGQATQGILSENANLKQRQQQGAQSELSGLYGTDTHGMLEAMGLAPQDINAATNSQKVGWLQDTEGALDTLGTLGLGSAKAAGFG
jgi:hypothetical protein